jgi:glycogen phosphorylase
MNGGLIIGTLDGANVEIAQEIDRENIFIFGAEAHEVPVLREERTNGSPARPLCPELAAVVADISSGKFGPLDDVQPILDSLRWERDWYLVGHDFPLYLEAQAEVDKTYADQSEWTRRTILSVAGMGKFSTDRTINSYAQEIWNIVPCHRPRPVADTASGRSFPNSNVDNGVEVDAPSF